MTPLVLHMNASTTLKKKKRKKSLILKLDLQKSYDCIDWDLLSMILIQVGFGLQFTNWIMSCVSTSTFVVLINGEATNFFRSGRGLRQGCPLSPMLFILVLEGLSLLLKESKVAGNIACIKVSRMIRILHIFFVDDILIMTNATINEWIEIDRIMNFFCKASGLKVNKQKSNFLYEGLSNANLAPHRTVLPYKFSKQSIGFRYLGFYLTTGLQKSVD